MINNHIVVLSFKLFIVVEFEVASYVVKDQINCKLFDAKIITFERFTFIRIFFI